MSNEIIKLKKLIKELDKKHFIHDTIFFREVEKIICDKNYWSLLIDMVINDFKTKDINIDTFVVSGSRTNKLIETLEEKIKNPEIIIFQGGIKRLPIKSIRNNIPGWFDSLSKVFKKTNFNIKDKNLVFLDDDYASGRTAMRLEKVLMRAGAKSFYTYVIFNDYISCERFEGVNSLREGIRSLLPYNRRIKNSRLNYHRKRYLNRRGY